MSARAAPPVPPLSLAVLHVAGDWTWLPADDLVARIGAAIPRELLPHPACEASIVLSDDAEVRALNRAWRGKDKPTNVLSFPAPPLPGDVLESLPAVPLGDVVLASETLRREARDELAVPPAQHAEHLIVHGLLHLFGFDHETDADARRMEGLEKVILATLGSPDPYAP